MILLKCGIKVVATKKRRDRRAYFRAYFADPVRRAARLEYLRKYFASDKGKAARARELKGAKRKARQHKYARSAAGKAAKKRWRQKPAGKACWRRCRERWLNTLGGERYQELHDRLKLPTCVPASFIRSIKLLRALKQEIAKYEYQ